MRCDISSHLTHLALYQVLMARRCRWSELLNEERPFTEDEKAFFDRQAHHAYSDFRNKVQLRESFPGPQFQRTCASIQPCVRCLQQGKASASQISHLTAAFRWWAV